jgi:hypothetical protein
MDATRHIQNCQSRIENELNPAMSASTTHTTIMIRAFQIRRGNMSSITLLNESLGRRQDNVYQRIPYAPRRETNISWSEMDAISYRMLPQFGWETNCPQRRIDQT